MILIYVRHGIAMERDEFARHCIENGIEGDDEQRPLTAEGKRKTKRAAMGLSRALDSLQTAGASPSRALQIRPLILTSPLLRARQTASILSKTLEKTGIRGKSKLPLITATLSPNSDPQAFRDFLYAHLHSDRSHRVHSSTVVIAVGHEPHLGQSVCWWMMGEAKARFPFKKGAATCLEIGAAMTPGEARLLWALPPWALRALEKGSTR